MQVLRGTYFRLLVGLLNFIGLLVADVVRKVGR